VDQYVLTCRETAVDEQRLPSGQPGERDGGRVHVIEGTRPRGEVTRLDSDVARRRAIAVPVRQPVDFIANREAGGTEA
jgi:hypothetical protein